MDGRRIDLAAPAHGATVLIFYSTECPISNSYSPTLATLVDSFPAKSVKWLGVCVDPDLSDSEVETHARDFGLKFPVVRDRHGSLARKLGAKVTPETFVIDADGKVRYHGRIDDQFVARRKRNANPSGSELKDAIAAVLNGKEVKTPEVEAVGCPLPEVPQAAARPTYCKDVASILQKNCQECHRPGQVGPFALETYDQARKRASDIAAVVEDRAMPPWKADPHVGVKFKDVRTLSDQDIATLVAWAEADAPEGNPADLPPPAKFPDDWQLGTPDLVIDIGADFAVPASGEDIYRCFVVPTHLEKDQYVTAVEYRPGNRRVVHHMLAFVDTSGKARERDQAEPGPGYTCFGGPGEPIHGGLGGWAPGNQPSFLPEGIGRSLPKQSDVIVQVHYHPQGKAETDRSKIGLYFAKKPVKQVMHWGVVINPGLELPPGQSNIEIKAAWEVPVDVTAHAVTAAHASPGTRHANLGEVSRRPRSRPDQGPRLGLQLAIHLPIRKAARYSQGLAGLPGLALRQLGIQPQEPAQAAQARQVGRGDHRRDVHRLPRRDQEGPRPDQARREGRLHGHLAQATRRAAGEVRETTTRAGQRSTEKAWG